MKMRILPLPNIRLDASPSLTGSLLSPSRSVLSCQAGQELQDKDSVGAWGGKWPGRKSPGRLLPGHRVRRKGELQGLSEGELGAYTLGLLCGQRLLSGGSLGCPFPPLGLYTNWGSSPESSECLF